MFVKEKYLSVCFTFQKICARDLSLCASTTKTACGWQQRWKYFSKTSSSTHQRVFGLIYLVRHTHQLQHSEHAVNIIIRAQLLHLLNANSHSPTSSSLLWKQFANQCRIFIICCVVPLRIVCDHRVYDINIMVLVGVIVIRFNRHTSSQSKTIKTSSYRPMISLSLSLKAQTLAWE